MCDTREESDDHAEGYSTGEKNQGCVGWSGLSLGIGSSAIICLYECFAPRRLGVADGKERPWKQRPLSVLTLYYETNKVEVNVLPIPSLCGPILYFLSFLVGYFPFYV